MVELPEYDGILVLPRLRIQNANCISSSFTWGFPSITAFMGCMWALQRKCQARESKFEDVQFKGMGVVCHDFAPQVHKGNFEHTFHLTRNPLDHKGKTAPIVEEGRAHMNVSLLLAYEGAPHDFPDKHQDTLLRTIQDALATMRVAGGTILPPRYKSQEPRFMGLAEDDNRQAQFIKERRRFLPGFALVSRDDLLAERVRQLRSHTPDASLLDAWLDLSRWNSRAVEVEEKNEKTGAVTKTIEWQRDKRDGWLVPIPVGYTAISELYQPGDVLNARDASTPFRFVESVYSMGQWIGPHRLQDVGELLWFAHTDEETGLYCCRNMYADLKKTEEESA
ncbi:MAG: type I-F CRISPR-associated protein Csy2 [Desulfovibrio sp.]|uniref:type I-F CRISPR-associated protein Csy2 n=1 Tax=Desulfovibrio sp. 7SRBS1 TaxID=3378064 RepID=UPI003B3C4652